MPPTGLRPIVARYSLAVLPLAQGGISPLRAWRSANSDRGQLADRLHVERARGAAPGVGDHAGVGVDRADLGVPEPPQLEEPLLSPDDVRPPRRILGVIGLRQFAAGRGLEVVPAMLAVAHRRSRPSG